ncbi:CHAP domain-containing protein [Jiangella muralis]|uniref:CHAP domain-containing protein n=1 Tax=Jiangella muralis TaxID=702383 RepID=UPI00069F1E21|nr:CHAP domain-containing protein [Jiangella muralis]
MGAAVATVAAALAWCRAQLGTRETGNNNTPYHEIAGHPDGWAWCGIFLEAMAKVTGLGLPGHVHYTPSGAAAFKAAGRWVTTPRPGDFAFIYYPELGRIGHIGIVEKVDGGDVITIEGNTNTTGSRTGIGVFRHRRKKLVGKGQRGIVGYGRPAYGTGTTKPPAKPKPPSGGGNGPSLDVVDLSVLRTAARHDPDRSQGGHTRGASEHVRTVERALVAEGLLDPKWSDASFGTKTVAAYAAWQRRCGYSGRDADGVPGLDSLRRLGSKHGFRVTA